MTNPAIQQAMTALIRNGGMGGGGMADTIFTQGADGLNWAIPFTTASGALPLVPVGTRGSRRRLEEDNLNKEVNPTAGTNTTGWGTSGTNTLARVSNFAAEGLPPLPDGLAGKVVTCFKITHQDNASLMADGSFTLAAADHSTSCYYLMKTGTANPNFLGMKHNGYTGATTDTNADVPDKTLKDVWQRTLGGALTPVGGDLQGSISCNAVGLDAGDIVYIAAVQVEAQSYQTSYTDGSLGTGYAWTGAAHASTSTRAVGRLEAAATTLDETVGAITFRLFPEFANTARTAGVMRCFDWADDANNFITVEYDLANNQWECARKGGSTLATAASAAAFAAGDEIFITAAWDAANVYISVGGAALTAQAQTDIPTLAATEFDIGSDASSSHCNAPIGPFHAFNRVPTDSAVLAMSRRLIPMGAISA